MVQLFWLEPRNEIAISFSYSSSIFSQEVGFCCLLEEYTLVPANYLNLRLFGENVTSLDSITLSAYK